MKQEYIVATSLENSAVVLNGIEINVMGDTAVKLTYPGDENNINTSVGGSYATKNYPGKEVELELVVGMGTESFDTLLGFKNQDSIVNGSFTRLVSTLDSSNNPVTKQTVVTLTFGVVQNFADSTYLSTGGEQNATATFKLKFGNSTVETQTLAPA